MTTSGLTDILNAESMHDVTLTPRILLSIINKPHDVLGLISPITIRAMVAYRDLFRLEPTPDWDDDIPHKEKAKWISILSALRQCSSITFITSVILCITFRDRGVL